MPGDRMAHSGFFNRSVVLVSLLLLVQAATWARKSHSRAPKHGKAGQQDVARQGSVVVRKISDSVFVIATGNSYFIYRIDTATGNVKKIAEWNPEAGRRYQSLTNNAVRYLQPRVVRLNNRDLLYMPSYSVISGRITVKQNYYELREGRLVKVRLVQ